MSKQKLELTWIGKEKRPKLEPRILLEDPEKSYHAKHRVSDNDIFDNRLIFGDNLLALKALEQQFAGQVKCIFIDPPYNTGSAFEHYDDGIEHSLWLSLMRDRLELLRRLLSDDDSLWMTIDDNEAHYLKVLCDEMFGRANFVSSFAWEKDKGRRNQSAKRDHLRKLLPDIEPFATPKPEELLKLILHISTNEGELVLDSFAGSGTTGAVAQKMGRRWIMVELGEHCETHIVPRLKKVVDGTDPGGITEVVDWKGGGGYRYYRLAPSLLEKDPWGNWVIAKSYDAPKLSQAVCKLMGFVYQPSETHYWMHGRSSEADFIYVTTQSLTHEQLAALSEAVGDSRTLLVCCKAFRANADDFPNLTIKKLPQAVLRKCEWGHDDYSLNVANLPEAPKAAVADDTPAPKGTKKASGKAEGQDDLFGQGEGK